MLVVCGTPKYISIHSLNTFLKQELIFEYIYSTINLKLKSNQLTLIDYDSNTFLISSTADSLTEVFVEARVSPLS